MLSPFIDHMETNFLMSFLLRKHDIHIKSKSYKLELLGELVI